jgi:hypothetical protein
MRSIKFHAKCIFLSVILLSLYGCPNDQEVPLTRNEEARIDMELVGDWLYRSANPNESGTITISPFNEHEFLIVIRDEGKDSRDYFRAFSSIIDGDKFLNVQEIRPSSERRSWTFVNYSVSQGKLTYRIVGDKLFKEKFTSSAALSSFIKAHLKDKELYNEDGGNVLTFVKEASPQYDGECTK